MTLEWFWRIILYASIAWYALLVFYVGIRGWQDIREMVQILKERKGQE
ncbi:MAG TPA: hypothetical protein PLZ55_07605 [bacterium]|nr:hypothetical protein [bacterium]HPO08518.1 hypothetical protein [bacterium]HQO35917.1 hypothetical protein [bacterium]HQQ01138.1 hypothetical protein [bacterium]